MQIPSFEELYISILLIIIKIVYFFSNENGYKSQDTKRKLFLLI